MPKTHAPLTPKEVEDNLKAIGFVHSHNRGDHHVYELDRWTVQVDQGNRAKEGFGPEGMKITIFNTGLANMPELFYRISKRTAAKIGKPPLTEGQIDRIRKRLSEGKPILKEDANHFS